MPDPTPEQIEAVNDALARGSKIEAIKIYREATGLGLKESKEFIEALIPRLQAEDPVRFAKLSEQKSGCSTNVLAVCVLVAALALLLSAW